MNRCTPILPPIPWRPDPITPLPEVFESNSDTSWALFDAAWQEWKLISAQHAQDQQENAS
jgi:hypothetical protein